MKYLITLFFLLFLFCPLANAQNDLKQDGSLWANMSDTEKYFYVKGVKYGLFMGALNTAGVVDDLSKLVQILVNTDVAKKKYETEMKNLKDGLLDAAVRTDKNIGEERIIDQMNIIYKDVNNKKIPINTVVSLSLYKIAGQDISELLLFARQKSSKE